MKDKYVTALLITVVASAFLFGAVREYGTGICTNNDTNPNPTETTPTNPAVLTDKDYVK